MTMAPGTRVGAYEVRAPLGAGGMGEVYRARDTKLDRDVALKILPEPVATDPDRLMRFEREAKTLAALNHPNIAAIYGIEDRALVMELVDGEDLSQRIARGPMPLVDVLPVATQIAEALGAAHEAGIVHRDLKPANIRVRADGTVKVLDFGLAKALEPAPSAAGTASLSRAEPTMTSPALTTAGLILGTAAYMAPEQARGQVIDRRADVWAFGVILHEMLTGEGLFDAGTVGESIAAVHCQGRHRELHRARHHPVFAEPGRGGPPHRPGESHDGRPVSCRGGDPRIRGQRIGSDQLHPARRRHRRCCSPCPEAPTATPYRRTDSASW